MQHDHAFEITGLAKSHGPLTKKIFLNDAGMMISDGSACTMSEGAAKRVPCAGMQSFADVIGDLESHEAIALGRLRTDLADIVRVSVKKHVDPADATGSKIARTDAFINYATGAPALALIDVDTKGMPPGVRAKIDAAGGFEPALAMVLPELSDTARVVRRSTSTGITRTDTREALSGSSGLHIFLLVQDGGDVERFLKTLHERCWLHGLGWHMVGKGGQLLDRSVVDRSVYAPERLVFEGPPQLVAPLIQDKESRRPVVSDGSVLDTRTACPVLTIVEQSRLKELKAKSSHALAPERANARDTFVSVQAEKLTKRTGMPDADARKVITRQCKGVLLPDVELPWDDETFKGCTVRDVLMDPDRFEGATLADPLEGVEYGRCKAKVMRRADGTPFIHSFAHGRTVYRLVYDAKTAAEIVEATPVERMADAFAETVLAADMEADEIEALRNTVADATGANKRTLDRKLKDARAEQASQRQAEARERKAAERVDHRPQIAAPDGEAPWLPQVDVLNEILGSVQEPEPPMRDVEGYLTVVRVKRVPGMHALTSDSANGEATKEPEGVVEQPLLHRLDEIGAAELIERHIDYVDEGTSVHLRSPFVRHFLQRSDIILPTVVSVATLPIVQPGSRLLAPTGLDKPSGTVFRIPAWITAKMPKPVQCTADRAKEALKWLLEEWLCDVLTDSAGKCALLTVAMTIIERVILPKRPAFMVSAAIRGGGKTTVLQMLSLAATGVEPSAASWSDNVEERRKSIMSYYVAGVPLIIWDNIAHGTEIFCPHIEKSLTAPTVADRILGETRTEDVPSTTIHMFTGNNILPVRDLASRTLHVRLNVERADPENRPFKHHDPIAWTREHRAKILRAFYIIMLAQPDLTTPGPHGRFPEWWELVGRPVENAARQLAIDVNFGRMFLSNEQVDSNVTNLVDALEALSGQWTGEFCAKDIARLLNDESAQKTDAEKDRAATVRDWLFPDMTYDKEISSKSVGRLLRPYVGTPVLAADDKATLSLAKKEDSHTKQVSYSVVKKDTDA